MNVLALIPARSGSLRIPHKNIKELCGHPLIAYTISAAKDSGIFTDIICVTDSSEYASIAGHYGAEIPFLRPDETATSTSPDLEWVNWSMTELARLGRTYDQFSILRPTSPFRTKTTIQQAWKKFEADGAAHSLRAISLCTEHPGKMWIVDENRMSPLLPNRINNTPWHSSQYASLPEIYVQNASLEIAHTRVLNTYGTISGEQVLPFISNGIEGFDINSAEDWVIAEYYANTIPNSLPKIDLNPWF